MKEQYQPVLVLLLIALLINRAGPVGYNHVPGDRQTELQIDTLIATVGEDLENGIDPHRAIFLFRPIDLNLADVVVLSSLRGIGPKLAARIVEWRNRHGSFREVSELLQVKGIGERKLAVLVRELTVSEHFIQVSIPNDG